MFHAKLGLVLGLFLASGSAVHADEIVAGTEIPMVRVTSSYPSGYNGKLTATVDERAGGVTQFNFTDSRGTQSSFTSDQLRAGMVLVHALGKDILKIAGPKFTNENGGQMILTFLRGFFGSDKREVRFDYVRHGGLMEWILLTDDSAGREPFDSIGITVSKTLGLPTGVGDITLTSSDRMVRHYDPDRLPSGTLLLDCVDTPYCY